MSTANFDLIHSFSKNLISQPQIIVENEDDKVSKQALSMIKQLHDNLINQSKKFKIKNENLVVKNMNEEQIWEQINIHLDTLDKAFEKYINTLPEEKESQQSDDEIDDSIDMDLEKSKSKSKSLKKQKKQLEDSDNDDDDDDEEDDGNLHLESEYEDDESEQEQGQKQKNQKSLKKQKDQQVEDEDEDAEDDEEEDDDDDIDADIDAKDFFDNGDEKDEKDEKDYEEQLDFKEMEAFLDKQDAEDIERDSEVEEELGSDYELDDGDSMMGEGENGFKFKGKDDYDEMEEEEGEGDNEENEKLREQDYDAEDEIFDLEREHEINQENKKDEDMEKLRNDDEIDRLEKRLIDEKVWLLKGEANAKHRPVNSLLDQEVDFRKNIKVTQEIDEKYNKNLEAIIKQRILDEAYDDRQKINIEQNFKETFNSFAEISKEQSKLGLGELYEQDFKNSLGLPSNNKEDKLKLEIHNLFKEVCYKLDALSNLSFTPKPIMQQAQITTNVPSLKHEERIPISVSQADTQRPEEVFDKKKQVTHQSKVEMTHEEKQTERRQKKSAQRQRNKEKEKKNLIKNLQYKGQTKFEYNQSQKAKANAKKLVENKRQKSVEFTKSSEFFRNMQNNQQLEASGKNNQAGNKTKSIKKKSK
ncbi:Mpp10 protein (macronuclear) [Tetrahymena thermophila SB210]|uniref:U3 small nucleolar ribonucleoprotein protein MPP10 n=1 Tax=Tetrahymena thermophila (strain SB210) TaxID=312017 RepID=Q241A5_TETTS|nr:Mpp10 protein [Tetrahymena thermophila SB210]EAS02259.1 Mpp10 protein [Tetrahymena thermophila SB210]|eukprot:XP_001022504.1 Mpp10 protein [Tetrahymena thermophila SB210]